MKNVEKWVVEWFVDNGGSVKEEIYTNMQENYIENGLVDSFGFLQLIADIEEKYKFVFEDSDFENEKLFVIEGLIEVIGDKIR